MTPSFGHGARRTATRNSRDTLPIQPLYVDSTQLGPRGQQTSFSLEDDHVRQKQRKRDRRERLSKMAVLPSPNAKVPVRSHSLLADRRTHSHDAEGQGPVNDRPRVGSPVQLEALQDSDLGNTEIVNGGNKRDEGLIVDDLAEFFGPEPPPQRPPRQPVSTRPVQYGSSHHLPFNLNLHPPRPVQPATSREPIRMINSFGSPEPEPDDASSRTVVNSPSKSAAKAIDGEKHPYNPYRGNDPVKRLVQNKKLQLILMGRPLPKPRKKADRMVLKCTGKQEFR